MSTGPSETLLESEPVDLADESAAEIAARSPLELFWRRLRHDKVALVALSVFGLAAFAVSVLNNFWWNRHWTFRSQREAHPVEQAMKFFAISLVAFGFSYVVLVSLVDGAGFPKVVAQAISIVAATPLSFVGQKLWSFRA